MNIDKKNKKENNNFVSWVRQMKTNESLAGGTMARLNYGQLPSKSDMIANWSSSS